jgi:SAM-dependent methyltransferase/uncharacterized protein YbaR (Trm112 family)
MCRKALAWLPDGAPSPLASADESTFRNLGALADRLAAHHNTESDEEVETGLLICGCGRWYPTDKSIPELLPDHLRDAARDRDRLAQATRNLPSLARLLTSAPVATDVERDGGVHYKKAEIEIEKKVDEPMFFVPGRTSPFASWDPIFTLYLIKLFGTATSVLDVKPSAVVVDSGCGYAWTTEWLFRAGFDPIGVDICRTYLDVAVERIGPRRPHLVVADVEYLPLRREIADSVLAYESFHHIPDRRRAMSQYEAVLKDGGTVVLAEPGAAHEHAPVAIDAMKKYGILEKGMELSDVRAYAEGTSFAVEQLFVSRTAHVELGSIVNESFAKTHSLLEGNLFRLVKGATPAVVGPPAPARPGLLARILGRLHGASGTS